MKELNKWQKKNNKINLLKFLLPILSLIINVNADQPVNCLR
jgi:hypothetical protein